MPIGDGSLPFGGDPTIQAKKVAAHACKHYPEIESWFETGTIGPHIRRVGFRIGANTTG